MSAITQNYVYVFGKKKDDAVEATISKEQLEKIKEAVKALHSEKK